MRKATIIASLEATRAASGVTLRQVRRRARVRRKPGVAATGSSPSATANASRALDAAGDKRPPELALTHGTGPANPRIVSSSASGP